MTRACTNCVHYDGRCGKGKRIMPRTAQFCRWFAYRVAVARAIIGRG
jgi:hypothetical protein